MKHCAPAIQETLIDQVPAPTHSASDQGPRPRAPHHPHEAGVATPMVVLTIMGLVTVAAGGVLALSYSAAARSVRAAADLVAVSGAQAHARGEDACDEARRLAGRNEVELGRCEVTGDLIDFVVEVRVSHSVGWRLPGLPGTVAATAYAGNVTGAP